jgi:uncharacterized protein (TIGR02147 family)
MIQKMGLALKLSPKEIETFVSVVSSDGGSISKRRTRQKQFNRMAIDVFNVISDWYHDAILELSRTRGFRTTPAYISRRLGITVTEARAAIERLQRVGLIEVNDDGTWTETLGDNTTTINIDYTNAALRGLQKQVLEHSLRALESIPKQLRDHTCMTMAINMEDLPEAKSRIKSFRQDLMSYLQRNGSRPNEVYQLAVSLYPLTKLETKKSEEKK